MKKSIIVLSILSFLTSLLYATEGDTYSNKDNCLTGLDNLKKYWSKKGINVTTKIFDRGEIEGYQLVDAELEFNENKESRVKDARYIFSDNMKYKRRNFFVCKDGLLFTDIIPTTKEERLKLIGALLNTKAAKIAKNDIFRINDKSINSDKYLIGVYDIMSVPLGAEVILHAKKHDVKIFLIPIVEERFAGLVKRMRTQILKTNVLFVLGIKKMDEKTAREFVDIFIKNPELTTIMSFFKEKNIKIDKNEYMTYINLSKKLGTFTSFLKNLSSPVYIRQRVYITGVFKE